MFAVILILCGMLGVEVQGKVVYVAPDGSDAAAGRISSPKATLPGAYQQIEGGDTICFRGGTYYVGDEQVMKTDRNYAYVFALEKAGRPGRLTCIMGYPGERPVFDFSALRLDGRHRFAAFYLGADYLHLRNFDIVGVPVRIKGHTQSECVAARKGSHCIVENLAMHDGMAIGYYQVAGSDNLVVNCDAYNNYDDYSEGEYGGNVDGFGCHVHTMEETGNTFRYCRAWRNSDDGFDLIHCAAPVEIDHCLAAYNGYKPMADAFDTHTFESAGDGNGFKAGGWGMRPGRTRCPEVCPEHYVHHCIAVRNKANGIYSNHHLGGCRWEQNTAWMNLANYNMVNRLSTDAEGCIDVPGYGHRLSGNVSWDFMPQPRGGHLVMCDEQRSELSNNSFQPDADAVEVTGEMFVDTNPRSMFQPRRPDGFLQASGFLLPREGSILEQRGMGLSRR